MTEPVADLRHLSTRLPENEQGGDPQTGEGAYPVPHRGGSRVVAGDPALGEPSGLAIDPAAASAEAHGVQQLPPETVQEAPQDPAAEPEPALQPPAAATEPLIPADNQPDVPASSTEESA